MLHYLQWWQGNVRLRCEFWAFTAEGLFFFRLFFFFFKYQKIFRNRRGLQQLLLTKETVVGSSCTCECVLNVAVKSSLSLAGRPGSPAEEATTNQPTNRVPSCHMRSAERRLIFKGAKGAVWSRLSSHSLTLNVTWDWGWWSPLVAASRCMASVWKLSPCDVCRRETSQCSRKFRLTMVNSCLTVLILFASTLSEFR